MLEEPKKLTIVVPKRRPTAAQIAAFQNVPTSFVSDAQDGVNALDAAIGPIGDGRDIDCTMAGPALTADNRPGDVLATAAALKYITPGDIVVGAVSGYQGCAAVGDRICGMAKNGGAAGIIVDGPMRDYAGIIDVGLPAFCTGLTPASPVVSGPGKVGTPVDIGGMRIETGDMIVADRDGVVVVPFDTIDHIIARLAKVTEMENALDQEVRDGLAVPEALLAAFGDDDIEIIE